jgi:hypothetical protein
VQSLSFFCCHGSLPARKAEASAGGARGFVSAAAAPDARVPSRMPKEIPPMQKSCVGGILTDACRCRRGDGKELVMRWRLFRRRSLCWAV